MRQEVLGSFAERDNSRACARPRQKQTNCMYLACQGPLGSVPPGEINSIHPSIHPRSRARPALRSPNPRIYHSLCPYISLVSFLRHNAGTTEYQSYHRLRPSSTSKDMAAPCRSPIGRTMARPEGNAAELGQPADQPRGFLFPEWKGSLASLSDQSESFLFRTSKDSSALLFGQPKSYPSAEPTGPSASMFSHTQEHSLRPSVSASLFGQPKSPAEGTLSIVIQSAGTHAKEVRISVEGPGGRAHHATSEPPASQDSFLRTQVCGVLASGSSATVEFGLPPHSPRS
jgi:hypothetical protein